MRIDALPFWRADHFPSTNAPASISKLEADKAMMHLLRVAAVRALVRPPFYFRIRLPRDAIGWVIGGSPDYE